MRRPLNAADVADVRAAPVAEGRRLLLAGPPRGAAHFLRREAAPFLLLQDAKRKKQSQI